MSNHRKCDDDDNQGVGWLNIGVGGGMMALNNSYKVDNTKR